MGVLGERRFAVAAFVALILFWGSAFTVIKVGLDYAPPMLFAGARALVGGLAVGLAALVWGGKPRLRREWRTYLLLILLNVVLFLGFQTSAIMSLPSGTAAVLIYLQPILTGFLAYLILGESLQMTKLIGLFLGFAGIVAVSAEGLSGSVSPIGIAFAVAAALAWALGTVYFKKAQERVPLLWAIAVQFTSGGIVLTAFGLLIEPVSAISLNPTLVASLLYAGLIGTGSAYVLWFGLVRAGEASRVAAYVFFVPLVAILLGDIFLGEALSSLLALGAVLVISGIYLANRGPRKERRDSG